MQETWVRSLGQKDPLKKEMSTHSSILAWEIRWTEEPGGLQSMGSEESDMTEFTYTHTDTDAHAHTHTHTRGWQNVKTLKLLSFR